VPGRKENVEIRQLPGGVSYWPERTCFPVVSANRSERGRERLMDTTARESLRETLPDEALPDSMRKEAVPEETGGSRSDTSETMMQRDLRGRD
jgi:hypothetical protein